MSFGPRLIITFFPLNLQFYLASFKYLNSIGHHNDASKLIKNNIFRES